MAMEGLELLRCMMPFLAGRLTLPHFTALALALGAVPDADQSTDLEDEDLEYDLVKVLHLAGGNVSAAARLLKVCSKTIYRRLRSAGVELSAFRTSSGPS
jgi:DNA-binding NtrC family response regulator